MPVEPLIFRRFKAELSQSCGHRRTSRSQVCVAQATGYYLYVTIELGRQRQRIGNENICIHVHVFHYVDQMTMLGRIVV